MKSYTQLAKAAYDAWRKSNPDYALVVRSVAFEQLHPALQERWVAVAKAISTELSTVH